MIIDKYNPHGGDIYNKKNRLDFSANINPLGISAQVRAAITGTIGSLHHYPDAECRELRKAISAAEGQDYEHILCGNGASELIYSFVLGARIKKAMIICPTFSEYERALGAADAIITKYFTEADTFRISEDILDKISAVDAVFVCNPNNPTGNTLDRQLLLRLLERCLASGIYLFVDECFNDWLDNPEEHTLGRRITSYKNLIILKALTKSHALAGLRLGYVICSDTELLYRMSLMTPPWNVSSPAQAAGVAALKDSEHFQKAKKLVTEEKKFMLTELVKLGFEPLGNEANYIFFRAYPELGGQLSDRGIMVRHCNNFCGLDDRYYRICVKGHDDNEILLEEMRGAADKWRNQ